MATSWNRLGYYRVAAAVPAVVPGDIEANMDAITQLLRKAEAQLVSLVVFPELCITGYSLGDAVQHSTLLQKAQIGLERVAAITEGSSTAAVVGLPWEHRGRLYNVAAVVASGSVQAIIPKQYPPNSQEFYEGRWYQGGRVLDETVEFDGRTIPFGTDVICRIAGLRFGVEICEDLWVPQPPGVELALAGAQLIVNPSASNELVGKAAYRRSLVAAQSARCRSAYVYSSAGVGESTTDTVLGGHAMIAENGAILAENQRFERSSNLLVADIDCDYLDFDRRRSASFTGTANSEKLSWREVVLPQSLVKTTTLERTVAKHPFTPPATAHGEEQLAEVFTIAANGLATRLARLPGAKHMIVGLSGGLDSTLALLLMREAQRLIGTGDITAITMPGFATSRRTKSNAEQLAAILNLTLEERPIRVGATGLLKAIGHDAVTQDVTYENAQARYRTLVLLERGNHLGGMVVGTGDLSEIALGWCTFNGDHISHYHVNSGIPKTLVRHVIAWAAKQPQFASAALVLEDILATPVSPELVTSAKGNVTQATEELIGPYELHDFFLYHFLRRGAAPNKLEALAALAFAKEYDALTIRRWLELFLNRFSSSQWKRNVMPDGPKVGTVALSPRGDWRMPSDLSPTLWQLTK